MSSLTPIGPQPPTQPGWYWVQRSRKDRVHCAKLNGRGDDRMVDLHAHEVQYWATWLRKYPRAVWQPVAAPAMEGA